jgi:BirA family biotin operon repressor/biotin-[acetyl-CoA-carboxylase] ligase
MNKYRRGKRAKRGTQQAAFKLSPNENPNSYVLRTLLNAQPHYVSGSILAEKLNMSRVGIWSRIEKLRDAGLSIEASQNLGYRLTGEPNHLNASLMDAWLQQCEVKCKFHLFDSTGSTNTEAEKLMAEGDSTPLVVLANHQTTGRGRRGNIWYSPKGGNLYLSIGLRPKIELVKMKNFTLWQGVRICQFLRSYADIDNLHLKWPNDLFYDNQKIGGMLTEASIESEYVRSLVFGLGLNVNASNIKFPKSIKNCSTSLSKIKGAKFHIHELAAKLIKVILDASNQCFSGEANELLLKEWEKIDFLREKKIIIDNGKERFSGIANGIDQTGALLVRLRGGKTKLAHAGEVSVA